MKYLLSATAAMAVLVLTGCHTNDYSDYDAQGGIGDERYVENPNDRSPESRVSDNMRDVGRFSPTSRFGAGNGSHSF
jgi:hypothetical protein